MNIRCIILGSKALERCDYFNIRTRIKVYFELDNFDICGFLTE